MKDSDDFAHGLNERMPAKTFYEGLIYWVAGAEDRGLASGSPVNSAAESDETAVEQEVGRLGHHDRDDLPVQVGARTSRSRHPSLGAQHPCRDWRDLHAHAIAPACRIEHSGHEAVGDALRWSSVSWLVIAYGFGAQRFLAAEFAARQQHALEGEPVVDRGAEPPAPDGKTGRVA